MKRIACSKCARRNDPWRTFCGACGGSLLGACAACGAVNQAGDKFCGGCAKSLAKTAKPKPPPPIPKPATHTIPITLFDEIELVAAS
jgi:RNA polymerase subunit RPABC4/transcription elongation factor Spt4